MTTSPTNQEQSKAEARKTQVLEAATECFRHSGFHGTSMAQISKAAGMSVGHIYHYFENKEAIIAAIVDRDLLNLLTITERIRQSDGDVLRAMIGDTKQCVDDTLNDPNAPLMLEIVAEAARNPSVATIVHKADEAAMAHMREFFREGLRFRGLECTDKALDGSICILASLFEGLSIRLIRSPGLDVRAYLPTLRSVIEYVIETLAAQAKPLKKAVLKETRR